MIIPLFMDTDDKRFFPADARGVIAQICAATDMVIHSVSSDINASAMSAISSCQFRVELFYDFKRGSHCGSPISGSAFDSAKYCGGTVFVGSIFMTRAEALNSTPPCPGLVGVVSTP